MTPFETKRTLVAVNAAVKWAIKHVKCNGAEGIRTPGLVNASHALCQLSYSPVRFRDKWYEIEFRSVKKSTFAVPSNQTNRKMTDRSIGLLLLDPSWLTQPFSLSSGIENKV